GQSARSPRFRGVQLVPWSVVSNSPTPWTIAQNRDASCPSVMSAEIPRWPGGWFAGSSHSSLPGCPSSVDRSDHVCPPSVLSKLPGASTPTSTRPCRAASVETFDMRLPFSPYDSPSLDCVQVSPRSLLRQTVDPCHSLAAAA